MSSHRPCWRSRILNPDAVLSPPPPPPLVDRSVISDPRGLYSIFYRDLPSPDDFKFHADPAAAADGVLFASFKLTRTHIQAIKKWIAARSPRPINCSTTVAAYAFVWAGHARARRSSGAGGGGRRRRLHFMFPADFRRRVEPPIPAEYFGNCIGPCFAEADAEELLGGEGLAAAAAAIARGIEELSSGLEGAENWMRRVKAVAAEQPLSAAGSPRFGVYETDFGWGRPRRVDIVSVANTGAVALAESRMRTRGASKLVWGSGGRSWSRSRTTLFRH
uniref:Uncharacterized protein n=1 Tax=Ananas comosus var. bracteatus TaxID=296719 RepID=A0A6V7NKT6_ANACO|nr:unnamed protein product [Ananas comosus var. bracteatus]